MNIQIADVHNMTAAEGKEVVENLVPKGAMVRLLFLLGNHWQNADAWVGPIISASGQTKRDFLSEVERSFIFYNSCAEISNRHINAILAKNPQWGSALVRVLEEGEKRTPLEDESILAVDGYLSSWVDSQCGVFLTTDDAIKTSTAIQLLQKASLYAIASGTAYLRVFIPQKYLSENGLQKVPLQESIDRIRVELCDITTGTIYVTPDDIQPIGVYVFKSQGSEDDHIESTFINETGQTVLNKDGELYTFDLAGELLHHQMSLEPILQDSVLSMQRDLNRILTMGGRNMNLAGFPERVLLDGMLPGEYEKDPITGKQKFIPDDFGVGAGAMNVFNGMTYEDEDGKTRHVSPRYERLDPVGNVIFDAAIDKAKQRIRDEADQGHVAMNDSSTASGYSREQARHEFVQSLAPTEAAVEAALKWMLSTVIRLAIATSTDGANLMNGLQIQVQATINPGPALPDERAEDRGAVNDGLMSKETAMTRYGSDDVDVERGRIESEAQTNLSIITERITAASQLIQDQANAEQAYITVGFDEETAKKLADMGFVTIEETATNDNAN